MCVKQTGEQIMSKLIYSLVFGLLIVLGTSSTITAAALNNQDSERELRVAEQRNNEEKARLKTAREAAEKAKDAAALNTIAVEEQRTKEEDERIAKLKAEVEYRKKLKAQEELQKDPEFQKKAAAKRAADAAARRANGKGW